MNRDEETSLKLGAMALVLLLEIGARLIPLFTSPLVTTLLLRLLQSGIMILLLRPLFIETEMGSFTLWPLKRGLRRGVIWTLNVGAVAGIGALALLLIGIPPLPLIHMRLPEKALPLALFFFTGGVVAPIAEELFFRGILYSLLRPMGVSSAIFISTLLFAWAHAAQGGVPLTQLAGGILFAVAFEKEGHIIVPILIHSAGNTALFSLSLI